MAKIIECKKCGGLIDPVYQDVGKITCPWCGRRFNRKGVKIVRKIGTPETALRALSQYFDDKEVKKIIPD